MLRVASISSGRDDSSCRIASARAFWKGLAREAKRTVLRQCVGCTLHLRHDAAARVKQVLELLTARHHIPRLQRTQMAAC